jgi:hypothetical protein
MCELGFRQHSDAKHSMAPQIKQRTEYFGRFPHCGQTLFSKDTIKSWKVFGNVMKWQGIAGENGMGSCVIGKISARLAMETYCQLHSVINCFKRSTKKSKKINFSHSLFFLRRKKQ